MPEQSGMADLIVKGAITLVTAAFFVAAYLQFQMSFWASLGGALGVYIILLMVHALMRRKEREQDLEHAVSRLEGQVARMKTPPPAPDAQVGTRMPKIARPMAGATPPPVSRVAAPMPPPMPMPAAPQAMAAAPPPMPQPAPSFAAPSLSAPIAAEGGPTGAPPRIFRSAAEAAGSSPREPRLMSHRPGAPVSDAAKPEPRLSVPSPVAPSGPSLRAEPLFDAGLPPAGAGPAAEDKTMHDYWPGASKPSLPDARMDGPRFEGPRVDSLRAEPPLVAERETDLDAVHGMIKRLADEVNVGDEPSLDGLPLQKQESVLRASLNALQTTASVMRATKKKDGLPPVSTGKAAGPTPPPIMPSHAKLAVLADAVAAGRIGAALTPIVGLADQQVHYYEVIACPRDERGNLLATTTRDPQLAIAGLLPLLDSARLRQAAQVAGVLAEEGRETCLFSPATAVSLANDGFLDELADAYRAREALANDLVMTFAQADVRTFGSSEWSALTDMRDLGFRFGIEDVTDFDYEFTALCAAGFAFVKLDAATLLGGLPGADGPMTPEDVCRNLSELGLTLIVTNIKDEATRDSVLEAGVPLGQGPLFGPPVEMGANAFAAAGTAAA